MEISSGNFLWEFASVCNEVKKLSSSHVFQHNSKTIVSCFIFFLVSGVFSDTDEFDKILVVKLLHDVEFML